MYQERAQSMRALLSDPNYLPTHPEIATAFGADGRPSREWVDFFHSEENQTFELLTREFIAALGGYLSDRVRELKGSPLPLTILEVGAGNGRLSHFLREQIKPAVAGKVRIVATDNGSWERVRPQFPVEALGFGKAIERYQPAIVICSWMPDQADWTPTFRQARSVQEYLLIGERDGCGSDATWGRQPSHGADAGFMPEYEKDGFERVDLDDISNHQICRTDNPGNYYHSQTVSFRRKHP